jgi:tetratricopeptide (TPR) repeat protein
MCMNFRLTNKEAAVLIAAGVILSPFLLIGAGIAGAGHGIKHLGRSAKISYRRRRDRRARRQQERLRRGAVGLNALASARAAAESFPWDSTKQLQYALTFFAVGDLHAALAQLEHVVALERRYQARQHESYTHRPTPKNHITATYFAGLCCLSLRRFAHGAELMEEAAAIIASLPDYMSTTVDGVSRSDALSTAAYLRLLAVVHSDKCRDVPEGVPGSPTSPPTKPFAQLSSARAAIETAIAAESVGTVRTAAIAAHIYYRLGLAAADPESSGTEIREVTVDTAALDAALSHVDRAVLLSYAVAADGTLVLPRMEDGVAIPATVLQDAFLSYDAPVDGRVVPVDGSDNDSADGNSDSEESPTTASPSQATLSHVDPLSATGVAVEELLSLKAQILLAYGDDGTAAEAVALLEIARQMNPDVPHSGLLEDAEAVGRDRRLGLLRPWPLPSNAFADDDHTRMHEFEEVRLWKPTWCDQCQGFIREAKGAFRCKHCKFETHGESRDCKDRAAMHVCLRPRDGRADHKLALKARQFDDDCQETSEPVSSSQEFKVTHQHQYVQRRVHTTHMCALCDKFIMLLTKPYQCKVCNTYAHTKCTADTTHGLIH